MSSRAAKNRVGAVGPVTDEIESTVSWLSEETPFNDGELYDAVEALYVLGVDADDVPTGLEYVVDFAEIHYTGPAETVHKAMPIVHLVGANIHGLDPIFSHVHKYVVRNPTTPLQALSTYKRVLELGNRF